MKPSTGPETLNRPFRFHIEAGIGHLVLSRPPQNRLDHHFYREFSSFAREELATALLRGLVLSARGKHFSSGADTAELAALLKGQSQAPDWLYDNASAFSVLARAPGPAWP